MNELYQEQLNVLTKQVAELEAENARLRQHNEQLVEFLLTLCNTLSAWKNDEFGDAQATEVDGGSLMPPIPPIRANFPPFDHRNLGKRGGR